jgi:tetratricopeptide (TPR) repeat protein
MSQAVHFVQKNHGDMDLLIRCLSNWGIICKEARNLELAEEKLKKAEQLCQSNFDLNSSSYGEVLMWLCDTYLSLDAIDAAMGCYQSSLKCFDRLHDIFWPRICIK